MCLRLSLNNIKHVYSDIYSGVFTVALSLKQTESSESLSVGEGPTPTVEYYKPIKNYMAD